MEIPSEVLDDRINDVGTSTNTHTIRVSDQIKHNNSFGEIVELNSEKSSGRIVNSYPKPPEGSGDGDDDIYVAVGKSNSSMDALSWALKNAIKPWSFVYLVHIFPPVNYIPTPLGNMAVSQTRKEEVDAYMNQEREKRREMLQKYQNLCRHFKVEFDVYLIERDQIVDAIVELIPVLNIKQLVVGTSKSNLRKMKRGGTKAGQIQKNAPHYCDVKIICEGKEVNITTDETPPTSPLMPVTIKSRSNENTPISSPLSHEVQTSTDKKSKNKVPKIFRCFSSKNM
ncbi:hypothetical protein LUZ60_000113 [Juncus effusus]|nr:hypothetical protein LUZ60_000113 [Juncus effusus]